jgi:hypothetical protein
VRDIVKDEITVAVRTRNLQCRLIVAWTAPAGELFVFQHLVRIKRRDVSLRLRRRQIFHPPKRRTPIEMLELTAGSDAHGIRASRGCYQPDLAGVVEANILCVGESAAAGQGSKPKFETSHSD